MKKSLKQCHILDLPNDCFYEIYKYLSVWSWMSLGATCTHLRDVSNNYFKQQWRILELNRSQAKIAEMSLSKELLRNFGHLVSELTIYRYSFEGMTHKKLVLTLDRYCTGLRSLKLVGIRLTMSTIAECDRLFSNLLRLVIYNSCEDDETLATLFDLCCSLKELELYYSPLIKGKALLYQFNALESATFIGCHNLNFAFVEDFFLLNSQLKDFKIKGCKFEQFDVMVAVQAYLPNLESLTLTDDPEFNTKFLVVPCLKRLKKLEVNSKWLSLHCKLPPNIPSNALAMNNIETLHLSEMRMSKTTLKALCQLTTLKTLKFSFADELDSIACKTLSTNLPRLSEVNLNYCHPSTFEELKMFAEHAINLKKIVIVSYSFSLSTNNFSELIAMLRHRPYRNALKIYLPRNNFENLPKFRLDEKSKHLLELKSLKEEHKTIFF